MMKKLGKTNGFTLIEMLIVVAIIAILIAVSIPMVNSSLEASRDAADQANERSAKAAAIMVYMGVAELERIEETDDTPNDPGGVGPYGLSSDGEKLSSGLVINKAPDVITNPNNTIYYDAAKGTLKYCAAAIGTKSIAPYGKCTCEDPDKFDSTSYGTHEGKILHVYISDGGRNTEHPAGEVVLEWVPINPGPGDSLLPGGGDSN